MKCCSLDKKIDLHWLRLSEYTKEDKMKLCSLITFWTRWHFDLILPFWADRNSQLGITCSISWCTNSSLTKNSSEYVKVKYWLLVLTAWLVLLFLVDWQSCQLDNTRQPPSNRGFTARHLDGDLHNSAGRKTSISSFFYTLKTVLKCQFGNRGMNGIN